MRNQSNDSKVRWRAGISISTTISEMLEWGWLFCTWRCLDLIQLRRASPTPKVSRNTFWVPLEVWVLVLDFWAVSLSPSWLDVLESCEQASFSFDWMKPIFSTHFLNFIFWQNKTGLYGFGLEAMCLILCVISIWTPGSPFDPVAVINSTIHDPFRDRNSTEISANYTDHTETGSYMSIVLLLAGITTARFG